MGATAYLSDIFPPLARYLRTAHFSCRHFPRCSRQRCLVENDLLHKPLTHTHCCRNIHAAGVAGDPPPALLHFAYAPPFHRGLATSPLSGGLLPQRFLFPPPPPPSCRYRVHSLHTTVLSGEEGRGGQIREEEETRRDRPGWKEGQMWRRRRRRRCLTRCHGNHHLFLPRGCGEGKKSPQFRVEKQVKRRGRKNISPW